MEAKNDTKFNNIVLIPTDFSEVCDNAVNHGVELARFLKYKVCLLHVINKETKSKLKKEDLDVSFIEKKLAAYKEKYEPEYGVAINTMHVEGSIFSTINEVAVELKANLMVLGTHGKKGLQHLFGSYALKVVLESPVPVIVVQKKSFGEGYKEIVFPVSNDVESRQKVQWAKLMSKLFNAKVYIFRSLEKDPVMNNRLDIITRQITDIFNESDLEYTVKIAVETTDYADQVLSYAVTNDAKMIMIMTRPNVDLPGFSLSGWDERLMFNDAQIPVMCINPVEIGTYYWEWVTPF
ncbi:MAG: universal stress protein [Bacteroidales bacterium]|nr:universal stress protein [Bacteroidales bacterium]